MNSFEAVQKVFLQYILDNSEFIAQEDLENLIDRINKCPNCYIGKFKIAVYMNPITNQRPRGIRCVRCGANLIIGYRKIKNIDDRELEKIKELLKMDNTMIMNDYIAINPKDKYPNALST